MADLGRTYQSKRATSHMTSKASRLREIVQEQKEEIERLKARFCEIIAAYDEESNDPDPDWAFIAGFAKGRAERALVEGGDADE